MNELVVNFSWNWKA